MELPDYYLDQLSEYIMDKRSSSLLGQQLIEDIDQSRADLKNDQSDMVFSPKDISVESREINGRQVFDYFGTYFYGFNMNGKFVAVPGDESSVIEQKPEPGVTRIILDEKKEKAETFIESFAGNSYGVKQEGGLMKLPAQKVSSTSKNPGISTGGNSKRILLAIVVIAVVWLLYRAFS